MVVSDCPLTSSVTVIALFPVFDTLAVLHVMEVADVHPDSSHPVCPTRADGDFPSPKLAPRASTETAPVNVLSRGGTPHGAKPVDGHGAASQSKTAATWKGDGAEKWGAGWRERDHVTCTGIIAHRDTSDLSVSWNKNNCQHEQQAHSTTQEASRFRREARNNLGHTRLAR